LILHCSQHWGVAAAIIDGMRAGKASVDMTLATGLDLRGCGEGSSHSTALSLGQISEVVHTHVPGASQIGVVLLDRLETLLEEGLAGLILLGGVVLLEVLDVLLESVTLELIESWTSGRGEAGQQDQRNEDCAHFQ